MKEKDFILNLLELSNSILKNENDKALKFATVFAEKELSLDQEEKINSIIVSLIDRKNVKSFDVLKEVINKLSFLNDKYLLNLIEISEIDFGDHVKVGKFLLEKLSEKIVFSNEYDEYSYYYRLSNIAIMTQDTSIISKAIEKVQSL